MFRIKKIVYTKLMSYLGQVLRVPVWAKWGCVDENGEVWVYARKPRLGSYVSGFSCDCTRHTHICNVKYVGDWKESVARLGKPWPVGD